MRISIFAMKLYLMHCEVWSLLVIIIITLLSVQVGVPAPHDHVRDLHRHHEVSSQRATSVPVVAYKASVLNLACHPFGCRFNSQISVFVMRRIRSSRPCCRASEGGPESKMGEEASACNTSMVLLNKGQTVSPLVGFVRVCLPV